MSSLMNPPFLFPLPSPLVTLLPPRLPEAPLSLFLAPSVNQQLQRRILHRHWPIPQRYVFILHPPYPLPHQATPHPLPAIHHPRAHHPPPRYPPIPTLPRHLYMGLRQPQIPPPHPGKPGPLLTFSLPLMRCPHPPSAPLNTFLLPMWMRLNPPPLRLQMLPRHGAQPWVRSSLPY